jgi:hypothetical protein
VDKWIRSELDLDPTPEVRYRFVLQQVQLQSVGHGKQLSSFGQANANREETSRRCYAKRVVTCGLIT